MQNIVSDYYRSIFEVMECYKERGVVVYGAGLWGELALKIMELFDVKPCCICDDDVNKWGMSICEYEVCSLQEAVAKYPSACFFAAADNFGHDSSRRRMNAKLAEKGLLTKYSGFHPLRYAFLLELRDDWKNTSVLEYPKNENMRIEHILVLNHTQNSGAMYLESLLDGHENILNIPGFGGWCNIADIYMERLKYLKGIELAIEVMAQLSPCISNRHLKKLDVEPRFYQNFLIYDKNGNRDESLSVEASELFVHLRRIIGKNELSFEQLLSTVYMAYDRCIHPNRLRNEKLVLLFHDHQVGKRPEAYGDLFSSDIAKTYLYIVREPVQKLFSTIRYMKDERIDQEEFLAGKWKKIADCDTGRAFINLEGEENVRIVRFEDLKKNPEKQMRKIAEYLDITYSEILLETTANGHRIYNKVRGQNGGFSVEKGEGTTALERNNFESIFSQADIEKLKAVFAYFLENYYPEQETVNGDMEIDFAFDFVSIFKEWFLEQNRGSTLEEWKTLMEETKQYVMEARKEAKSLRCYEVIK